MKAFLLAMVLLVGATAIAAVVLDNVDMSAKQMYSSDRGNVRL